MLYLLVAILRKIERMHSKIARHLRSFYYTRLFQCKVKPYPKIHENIIFASPEKIRCGRSLVINAQCYIAAKGGITFGDEVSISVGVKILTSTLAPSDGEVTRKHLHKPVKIGSYVWLGTGATILPGVTIADNCVIAAGALVTKDCESGWIYAGVPAKPIRRI